RPRVGLRDVVVLHPPGGVAEDRSPIREPALRGSQIAENTAIPLDLAVRIPGVVRPVDRIVGAAFDPYRLAVAEVDVNIVAIAVGRLIAVVRLIPICDIGAAGEAIDPRLRTDDGIVVEELA